MDNSFDINFYLTYTKYRGETMKDMEVYNTEMLESGEFKLVRKSKSGIIFLLCLAIGLGGATGCQSNNGQVTDINSGYYQDGDVPARDQTFVDENEVIIPSKQEDPINISIEEINNLYIIINDNDCREDFINAVCEELDNDGIKFTFTRNGENIDVDGAVVITLDQQYMAGPGTVVFAPLENGRLGYSDALAIAAQKAFYEKGFLIDGIACGQMGFRENENGTISERIPTETEAAIGKDKLSSFITISFGTQNTHAGLTAAAIEATLVRYASYLKSEYGYEDLIYCVEDGQTYTDISPILGVEADAIDSYNETSDSSLLLTGETIINPNVAYRREFNKHVPTNLYVDKTIWSK